MERVRLSADVEPELRRRVRVAAAASDRKVSDWISDAVKRELEREEAEAKSRAEDAHISQASLRAFERDWASEDDAVYDELAK
jgi:rRNA-processing protein FCF1